MIIRTLEGQTVKNSPKDIARSVIEEVAPDEVELFDQLWAEASSNPDLLTAEPGHSDRHLGAGIPGFDPASLVSLVVIPVVIAVSKDAAVRGLTAVTDYLKERLRAGSAMSAASLTEADVDRIAEAVARKMAAKTNA